MKTLLTAILLLLTATTAHAQFKHQPVQSYVNEVFENDQGYIDEYGGQDGVPYARGFTSEYMDFELVRTMVGFATTTNRNVELFESWSKTDNGYNYSVVIDRKYAVVVMYHTQSKGLVIAYTEINH